MRCRTDTVRRLVNASFYLYFKEQTEAEQAGARLRGDGYDVTVREGADDISWLALAGADIREADLDGAEEAMSALAAELGGEYDGYERAVGH
jgi:hypothetical protein